MKSLLLLSGIVVCVAGLAFGQIAQGPATGSVPSGVVVNTDNFASVDSPVPGPRVVHQHPIVIPGPVSTPLTPPTAPEGSNYIENGSAYSDFPPPPPPITVASFQGDNLSNGFPPDPYIAVGPNHIIQVINSSFRISDKAGNTLKTIQADAWYQSVLPNPGAFDPKVHYDQQAHRWIMVWDNQNNSTLTAYFLVSVSDDDNPLGVWFNWALPANVFGSTNSGTWQDYPGLGYDAQAYYITGRHFGFVSGYFGNAVRVLPKAQFLGSTPGPIAWSDFWTLRDLSGRDVDGVRPSVVYSLPNEYYLAGPPSIAGGGGTYFALYRITNPLGTPAISCVHVPVTAWSEAPNAGQLGGGTAIETGGSRLRQEPIYRDSSLWIVHSINNGGYSAVRYVRINTPTNTAVEDVAGGTNGFWHYYPAMVVDKDNNIAVTFTRSSDTSYASAGYMWRLASDPPGFRSTETVRAGAGNYVVLGSGRNRWGDYMGAALDPADRNNIWFLTEYASATNVSNQWVQGIRVVPYAGARFYSATTSVNFGNVEAGFVSDTVSVAAYNIGSSTLTVSSITASQTPYALLNLPSFPANIATFDSLRFKVVFRPTTQGVVIDTITIVSSDPLTPTTKIPVSGKGIVVGRAQAGVMYAVSMVLGSTPGQLYSINPTTGAATVLGPTGVSEIDGLAIRPPNMELFGVFTSPSGSTLYRMSRQFGDALFFRNLGVPNMRAIAFSSTDGMLYGGTSNGRLYRINPDTGDTTYVGTANGKIYSGFAISPTSDRLWASVRPPISGRDSIFTVDRTTGFASGVGRTGLNVITPYLAFNHQGNLFAIIGSGSQTNTLYSLDTLTAAGTLIGSTGTAGLLAIAMRTDSSGINSVGEGPASGIPGSFELSQNYPNPFNPSTQIRYGLPGQSRVTIAVYNVLGQEVARLVDAVQSAGYHEVVWNGMSAKGVSVASGIYLYKIDAHSGGKAFAEMKKMLLLR